MSKKTWYFLAPFIFPFLDSLSPIWERRSFVAGFWLAPGRKRSKTATDVTSRSRPGATRTSRCIASILVAKLLATSHGALVPVLRHCRWTCREKSFRSQKKNLPEIRGTIVQSRRRKIQAMTMPQMPLGHRHLSSLKSFSIFIVYQIKYFCQSKKKKKVGKNIWKIQLINNK